MFSGATSCSSLRNSYHLTFSSDHFHNLVSWSILLCVLVGEVRTGQIHVSKHNEDLLYMNEFHLKNSAVGLYSNMVVFFLHTSLVISCTVGYIHYGHR